VLAAAVSRVVPVKDIDTGRAEPEARKTVAAPGPLVPADGVGLNINLIQGGRSNRRTGSTSTKTWYLINLRYMY